MTNESSRADASCTAWGKALARLSLSLEELLFAEVSISLIQTPPVLSLCRSHHRQQAGLPHGRPATGRTTGPVGGSPGGKEGDRCQHSRSTVGCHVARKPLGLCSPLSFNFLWLKDNTPTRKGTDCKCAAQCIFSKATHPCTFFKKTIDGAA